MYANSCVVDVVVVVDVVDVDDAVDVDAVRRVDLTVAPVRVAPGREKASATEAIMLAERKIRSIALLEITI